MVFAKTEHLDILDDHHFVVGDLEQRAVEDFPRVHLVALGQLAKRARHAFRRAAQSVAVRIFAELDQHSPNESGQFGFRRGSGRKFVDQLV